MSRSSLEIQARTPEDIDSAYRQYYSRLADVFRDLLPLVEPTVLLEAGCGKGQLTIPLLRRLPKTKVVCIDSSRGPYVGWLEDLQRKTSVTKDARRIRFIRTDVRKMSAVRSESVDALISNELICDLTRPIQLVRALKEFRRVLKPKGSMIHGEWSSYHDSKSLDLTAKHSPSWDLDELFSLLAQNGFDDIAASHFDTTIIFGHDAAVEELRNWGLRSKLIQKQLLAGHKSMRLPSEHIVFSRK